MCERSDCADGLMTALPLDTDAFEIRVTNPLTTRQVFLKALPKILKRSQGTLNTDFLRRIVVHQDQVHLDPDRIAAFRRCCQFDGQADGIPLPFPETCFTPLMAEAIVSPVFPLSPLGIIHLRQTVTQQERLDPGSRPDARCELVQMRDTERGIEFDFEMQLSVGDRVHWSGLGTMLSRHPQAVSRRRVRSFERDPETADLPKTIITVPADTGRQYARASGDWNPQHLWKLTALPLGFRRPIAHGMWTFSRVAALALAGVDADTPVTAEAAFRRPLFLPSTVECAAFPLHAGHRTTPLAVHQVRTDIPHLTGQMTLRL